MARWRSRAVGASSDLGLFAVFVGLLRYPCTTWPWPWVVGVWVCVDVFQVQDPGWPKPKQNFFAILSRASNRFATGPGIVRHPRAHWASFKVVKVILYWLLESLRA